MSIEEVQTERAGAKTLLWQVSGKELTQPSFLFGTMHLMCEEDAYLTPAVQLAIDETEEVYLEVDLQDMSDLNSGNVSLQMQNGITLSDLLTEAEFEKVKAFFEEHQPGFPFSFLKAQHPLMLSSSLYELFLPCENRSGMDVQIVKYASASGKQVKGLETISFQASLFDEISYEEQATELFRTIDSIDKHKTLVRDMLEVYKTQDIEELHRLTTKEEMGISSYTDLLVYTRNEKWVEVLGDIISNSPVFVAVGAGHLGGDRGLVNLLMKRGYTLLPIENQWD